MAAMALALDSIFAAFADAGQRLCELGASEGASGNLSVCLRGTLAPHGEWTVVEDIELPLEVPGLAGAHVVVTGSSTRSRDLAKDPVNNLGMLEVQPGGARARLLSSPHRTFARITSEFNSHLAVHSDHLSHGSEAFHAVVHAQPRRLTYLSHIVDYQDEGFLNQRLLRWQPETVLNLPEGIACVPFAPPSSPELMTASAAALRDQRAAIWAKHGIMVRSAKSLAVAVDLIDYLEAAAAYECMDLALGQRAQGLDDAELDVVCATYGLKRRG